TEDAQAVLSLGQDRVGAGGQVDGECKGPHARAGLGGIAQQGVVGIELAVAVAACQVESYLRDGAVRVGVGDVRGGQREAASRFHWVGAGREGAYHGHRVADVPREREPSISAVERSPSCRDNVAVRLKCKGHGCAAAVVAIDGGSYQTTGSEGRIG